MAGNSVPETPQPARKSWAIPAVTAVILISGFCLYYFVYVAAQREYLANRNFRSLAILGDQIQSMVSIHGSILEFSADLGDPSRKESSRGKQDMSRFLIVRPEDKGLNLKEREQETRKDYLRYLAPDFELTESSPEKSRTGARPDSRLDVRRRNGHWELLLTAQRHKAGAKEYSGSVEMEAALKPFVGSLPFDDILLVSEKGTVVYQSNKAGPRFVTLTDLLQAQPGGPANKGGSAENKGGSEAGSSDAAPDQAASHQASGGVNANADQVWRNKSMHLTEVVLAGTTYKLFLQPVLLDVFNDEPGKAEPASEWVLCGLRSSKALEWEALSISSTFMVWLTAGLLAICMSAPVLKVLFINRREHLRLRELGFLSIGLVLLTAVCTVSGLEIAGHPMNDDTETQLRLLGDRLSGGVHEELRNMRNQLRQWCGTDQLASDLKLAGEKDTEIIRNVQDSGTDSSNANGKTPRPAVYPFVNNAFWTDDDGNQIVKWSTSGYLTPMIDISRQEIFTHPRDAYLDGEAPAFFFDSTMPPNKLEYLSALTVSTRDCVPEPKLRGVREDIANGYAFVTTQPLSLIDPILPFGYGFALLDQTGLVLFHSDKTRNLRENFLQESDWNRQLYAASFGHATQGSLAVRYLGKDYQMRAVPVAGVSQAPWSLVVYRDLTGVRTLNLQALTMTSTLLLAILLPPLLGCLVWCATRRFRFAPEWVWPNPRRSASYLSLLVAGSALLILFAFGAFDGTVEQNILACALLPYLTLIVAVWCFRQPAAALIPASGALALVLAGLWHGSHLYWISAGVFAAATMANRPRRYLTIRLRRSLRLVTSGAVKRNGMRQAKTPAWRACYTGALILMLALLGVLLPTGLFRASVKVERRLAAKEAQLHLASTLGQRLMETKQQCEKHAMGDAACEEFTRVGSNVWSKIVLDPFFPVTGGLPIVPHPAAFANTGPGELYSPWLQSFIYALHHDYNQEAAEMLGVIPDRAAVRPGAPFPDWSWEGSPDNMTLRWHGIHLPGQDNKLAESDLLIESKVPIIRRADALAGIGVALTVLFAIGFLVRILVSRIFLFHIEPFRVTGSRLAQETIRAGRNVVVLVPPGSDWRPEGANQTIDIAKVATGHKWAEEFDLATLAPNAPVELHRFEYSSGDPETDNQRFVLLDRLAKQENTQAVVILGAPASPEDHGRNFPGFEIVDLREEPFYWLRQYEGPGRDLIWKECGPIPALWPMGAQLARDIAEDDDASEETVASEIRERADAYYRLVWKESSGDQKFVLAQLAEDGLVNPANHRAIRQLVRRGLIASAPQFRIVNESLRRFARSAAPAHMKQEWTRDAGRSGWGKMRGAFFTTLIILGAFLLTTQNSLWESSAAYVTTALGAFGTLAKLFNTYRGGGSGPSEKAG